MAWERAIESTGPMPTVHRVSVPGGWLYGTHINMVYVPDPGTFSELVRGFRDSEGGKVSDDHHDHVLANEAWERGHKAGWMQAKADTQAADKPRLSIEEEAGYELGYSRGHKDGYEAAVRDGLKESNAKACDRDNANYELGYSRGFNDGLSGTSPWEDQDDKVIPLEIQWVAYERTDDLESYPTGIYRLIGPFKTPGEAWAHAHKPNGGVFAIEPPLEPVNPHDSEEVAQTFHRFKNVDEMKQAYQRNLEAEPGFVGKKKPSDPLSVENRARLLRQAANELDDGAGDYPKYLVVGTLPTTEENFPMTHGLFDTYAQAMKYAGECHSGYNAFVVELAKPLYVREGK